MPRPSASRICSSSGANGVDDARRPARRRGRGPGSSITVAAGTLVADALELAAAHVAEPAADRLGRVEIDDEQRLLEPGRARDHLALVVEHDGVAVEDELVLAADEVAEGEVRRVVARPGDEHLLAVLGLADVERRGGEVDDQLRAGE